MTLPLLLATLLACGPSDCSEACDDLEHCAVQGNISCDGDVLVQCTDGELIQQEDCFAADETCVDEEDGEAFCEAALDEM